MTRTAEDRERDRYYTLDLDSFELKGSLKRMVRRAREKLNLEWSTRMGRAHRELTGEFVDRVGPPPRVRELLLRMPVLLEAGEDVLVLNAWTVDRDLTGFYIVDLAARKFSSYVIGCHSKKNYFSGASDLLCDEMIRLSREQGKKTLHLGLGVNQGIKRFKMKWGGLPTMNYDMCEIIFGKAKILDIFRAFGR
jgi:hypothetical protein